MHSVALAVTEVFTFGTFARLHPRAVAIWLIAIFPYIYEIILVDVALCQVAAYAGAG